MTPPRVRFTVRGMIVAVAVAGLIAWGSRTCRLTASYRSRAESYRLISLQIYLRTDSTAERDARHDRWIQGQIRKYERAARYPWIPIAPDPPEPE